MRYHRFKIALPLSNTEGPQFLTEPIRCRKTNLQRRRNMRISFYLSILTLLALVGCAEEPTTVTTTTTTQQVTTTGPAREVLVTQAPPPVRVETQTVAPGPGYLWTSGYWRWTGTTYVWVPGTYVLRPRPAAVWVVGHWMRRPGGWAYTPGHWQ